MAPLDCQRARFAIPDHVAYLNCAYMGPLPRVAVEAFESAIAAKTTPWEIQPVDFFEPVERFRSLMAEIYGSDVEGVAVIPSTSYGVAIAAANLPVETGQRIVVLAEQFPSNVYAWRELAEERDATVVTVERPGDGDWNPSLEAAIDEQTAIVALPPLHWTDGSRIDLEAAGRHARAVGAALVVDGTQAIGGMPFDVEAVQPDYLVASTYKWLLGPYSLASVWIAPAHREGRPLEQNWIARRGSDDFARLVDYSDAYGPGARRFDMGEVSHFPSMACANASLELLAGWGIDRISAYNASLTELVVERAVAAGLRVPAPHVRSPHLIGVGLPLDCDLTEVKATLADTDVHVSIRGDSVRISAHVFNTPDDVHRLFDTLERLIG